MSNKAELKKKLILEKARDMFAQKGFKDVTMKDIVEACDISRGGLYLYYESTTQIFLEVLKLESEDTDEGFSAALSEDSSITEIITFFLKEQKKELLNQKNTLAVATYEFFFANSISKDQNSIRHTFDDAVKVLASLIEAGVETGEFICDSPKAAARNIMLVIEGMKIAALTMDIDSRMIDEQIDYIMSILIGAYE